MSLRQHDVLQKAGGEVRVGPRVNIVAQDYAECDVGCVLLVAETADEALACRVELSLERVEGVCRFHGRKALVVNGDVAQFAVSVAREEFGFARVCEDRNHAVIVAAVVKLVRVEGQQRSQTAGVGEGAAKDRAPCSGKRRDIWARGEECVCLGPHGVPGVAGSVSKRLGSGDAEQCQLIVESLLGEESEHHFLCASDPVALSLHGSREAGPKASVHGCHGVAEEAGGDKADFSNARGEGELSLARGLIADVVVVRGNAKGIELEALEV